MPRPAPSAATTWREGRRSIGRRQTGHGLRSLLRPEGGRVHRAGTWSREQVVVREDVQAILDALFDIRRLLNDLVELEEGDDDGDDR